MRTYDEIKSRIITSGKAKGIFTASFRRQHRVVFTNGCFDLLHRGHVYYLSRAKEMGDVLVVGLNSDTSVKRLKGSGRPVNDQQARAEVLAALVFVDYVIIFDEDTPLNLIRVVRPHVLVKGGDYRADEVAGYREVTSWKGRVEIVPLLEGYSTSSMMERLS
jgi:rfaE bifunctional protein nucleotidyltransferase chain/domain